MKSRALSLKNIFLASIILMFFICVYKTFFNIANLQTRTNESEENSFPCKSGVTGYSDIENNQSVKESFIRNKISEGSQSELLTVNKDRQSMKLPIDSDHVDSPERPHVPIVAPQISSDLDGKKRLTDLEERPNGFYYSIHFGSFKNLSKAKERIELLSIKGLHAWLEKVNIVGKGEWFRVYIGKYKTKAKALSICETLKTTGIDDKFYIHRLGSMTNLKAE